MSECLIKMMKKPVWHAVIESCADPDRARRFLDNLGAGKGADFLKKVSREQARILAALLSGSKAMAELLLVRPDWLEIVANAHPRQMQSLKREVQEWFKPMVAAGDFAGALKKLREFKQKEMLRIAARDLGRLGSLPENIKEISNVADTCLCAVYELSLARLTARFGRPYHLNPENRWESSEFTVLGLGKLGGQELNYSSDVDVVFLYAEEGNVFREHPQDSRVSGKGLTNHQFFTRLAESIVGEISRLTPEGVLFRIDLRLRPEGSSGPLVRSLESYENYYAQWGQPWERLMLMKARCVAGDPALASEFLESIQSFRYPRMISDRIVHEISAMKRRIEKEVVKPGELDRNVKLGRGGIREVEFVVQTLQLLNAGRIPFLQDSQTLPALQKLVRYSILPEAEANALSSAYCFLRDVEHRLQMESEMQTHTIPTERKARTRLARLMGFETLAEFENEKERHAKLVRGIYEGVLNSSNSEKVPPLPSLEGDESLWLDLLSKHGFHDCDRGLQLIRLFVRGPGYVHVSSRTSELALQLISNLFEFCPNGNSDTNHPNSRFPVISDPDRVLARLDSFITAYGSRAMLYETWTSSPSLFKLLVLLFDRSEFLAETAIRTPDLVDDLQLSGRLRRSKSSDEILGDLGYGISDRDQYVWVRQYHQAELMRIGLRDILGLADYEQNLEELSALADACLRYALEAVMRKHKLGKPPFAIIGFGKLGGTELNYGSDLDVVFVTGSKQKNLPRSERMAAEVMDLLSRATELGNVFEIDARLRPDGEKGLLVNTVQAYEEYYQSRAQLWEIQALTRIRAIAGCPTVGRSFQELAASITDFSSPRKKLAAFVPNWKTKIHEMRMRIERERTPAGMQRLAIKTGNGGLMDAEFVSQVWAMQYGWHEPNTLLGLERGRQSNVIPPALSEKLIANYRKLRRVEGVLRRWSYKGESLLPDSPAPLRRVALRCDSVNANDFMKDVEECRTNIRSVYDRVLPG